MILCCIFVELKIVKLNDIKNLENFLIPVSHFHTFRELGNQGWQENHARWGRMKGELLETLKNKN